jgi:hypothetical protein
MPCGATLGIIAGASWIQPQLRWSAAETGSLRGPAGEIPQEGGTVSKWATVDGTFALTSYGTVPLTLSTAVDGQPGVCGPLNSMMTAPRPFQCAGQTSVQAGRPAANGTLVLPG